MKLFTSRMLEQLMRNQKKKSESLLPGIIKRLIQSECSALSHLRIPDGDDVWAPGYDGIVVNETKTPHVAQGKSVWEFGTNTDSLEKINSDWKKRTARPLGVEKSETTFYLVVPKIWAYNIPLMEWEREHREEWKAVHVYDASVLCDWLNLEPAVCTWVLQNYLGEQSIMIDTVAHAWEQLARRTEPPLGHGIFRMGRETQIEDFQKKITENLCRVVAGSRIEAYGFCLSALLKEPMLADGVTVLYSEAAYHQLDNMCENNYFLLMFPYDGQISERNRVILCEGKGVAKGDAVQLPPRWKTQYLQALHEMGIGDVDAEELYSYTHGNLPALIRRIAKNEAGLQPEWKNVADIDLLRPLVLLRRYNSLDEEEQRLLSRLAGTPYPTVERKYEELLRMDDNPIQKVGKWYQIVNDEEAWLALDNDIESAAGQRMYKEICAALSCTDEAQNSRRGSVLQRLLRNYMCFAETGSNQSVIDSQVREILSFFHTGDCREYLIKELRVLALAAPKVVLEFLQQERLGGENDILWTLDVLIEQEDTCVQACQMLYRMAVSEVQDEYKHKEVKQHLMDALCLWSCHTALTLRDKKTLMTQMIQRTPEFGVEFGIELIGKGSLIRGHHRGEKKRRFQPVSEQELFTAYDEIAWAVYDTALKNRWIGQIENLLKEYRWLGQDILLKMAERFDAAQFSAAELQPIHYWLRTEIYNTKEYNEPCQTDVMEVWLHRTEPNEPIRKFGWMFLDWYQLPAEELLNDKNERWEKREEDAEKLRTAQFTKLKTEYGMDAVQQLLETMKDQYEWGEFLAKNITNQEFATLAEVIREQKKLQLLVGLLDKGDFQEATSIFEKLPESEEYQLLHRVRRKEVTQWLTTPERKQQYWKRRIMWPYDEQEYQQLLQYHPGGLLPYLYAQSDKNEQLFSQFKEVFEAIVEQGLFPGDMNYLSGVVSRVDAQSCSEEWSECFLRLYKKGLLKAPPKCLQRYLFFHPEEMVSLLKDGSSFRTYADFYYILPKEAFQDKGAFDRWCECMARECCDVLERILGRSGNGGDGVFPHEFVREFLEGQRDEILTNAIAYEKIYSRGVRVIQDGRDSYEESKRYRAQARELELTFPQSAAVLRKMAECLEAEAWEDKTNSELLG